MKLHYANIEKEILKNKAYRRVVYTVPHSFQLVYMSIPTGDYIHNEKHPHTTQFIRVEKGLGIATISHNDNRIYYALSDGISITIPPNTFHKIENVGKTPLKLYTIYTPPEHPINTIQHTNPDL